MAAMMEGEQRVLRIGGIAGFVVGVTAVVRVIAELTLVPVVPPTPEEQLMVIAQNLPITRVVEGIVLFGLSASIVLVLALYWSLRGTRPAYPLGGLVLWIVGLGFIGMNATNNLLLGPVITDLYLTGTAAERTSVLIFFQGINQVHTQLQFIGDLLLVLSFLSFGTVMLGSGDYGRPYGGVSILLALIGVASLVLLFPIVAFVLLIPFAFVFGWKVYALSRGGSR